MATGFDYDVIVIGSGFGGSVAAMRAVEKGYSVCVLEAGRRWEDKDLPKTSWKFGKLNWQPELELAFDDPARAPTSPARSRPASSKARR